jgi:predicted metal-dependent enzyme (double-stranded beta helix superfamily)
MFNKDKFIQDCIDAVPGGQPAMREVVAEAVSDGAGIVAELGEPEHAGINPLYRSAELTILNFAWAPCMSLMPHNHQMYAVIGISVMATSRHSVVTLSILFLIRLVK